MFGLYGAVGVHVDLAVETVSVVMAVHPCPTQESVEQPAFPELVFITHAEADHHAVSFAVTVFEFQFPPFDVRFRHVEGHHADVCPQIPAPVMLLEIAAVFAHEDGEEHVLFVDRLPWRDDDVGLQGRFGRDGELHGGIHHAHQGIGDIELDISLRGCLLRAEQREQECRDAKPEADVFHRRIVTTDKDMKKSGQHTVLAGF